MRSGTLAVFLGCIAVWCTILTEDPCKTCNCTRENNYTHVNCSRRTMSFIPYGLPEDTISLNMSHNALRMIKGSPFVNVSSLQILDLFNTSLLYINQYVFNGLTSLKHFNISNNPNLPITNESVSDTLFEGLTSLTELRMYGNTNDRRPGTYPDEALAHLTSLSTLWLDGRSNKTLGEGFKNLTKLTVLRFQCCSDELFQMTHICNGTFSKVVNLTQLVIRDCDLIYIHADVLVPLTRLVHLDLSVNRRLGLDMALAPLKPLADTSLISILKLNKIHRTFRMDCGPILTKDHAEVLHKLPIKELHLESNALQGAQGGVTKLLPDTLEAIYARDNEFRADYYLLEVVFMKHLKKIDISFQFFPTLMVLEGENINIEQQESDIPSVSKDFTDSTENTFTDYAKSGTDAIGIDNSLDATMHIHELPPLKENKHLLDYFWRENEIKRQPSNHAVRTSSRDRICADIATNFPFPIRPKLPPKLEYIDISHSKLAHPIYNFSMALRVNNSVKYINASQSMLYCWDGPVDGLQGLLYLDLRLNFCTHVRLGFFDLFPNLKVLLIGGNLLGLSIEGDDNGELLDKLTRLEYIDVSMNRLAHLPVLFFKSTYSLRIMNVSLNLLARFDVKLNHMHNLKVIDLAMNQISRIEKDTYSDITTIAESNYNTDNATFVLNLTNNNIQCTCNNIDFLKWIHAHQGGVLRVQISNCIFTNGSDQQITGQDLESVINDLEDDCKSYFGVALGLSLIGVLLVNIIIGTILYRYRWKLRYLYYIAGRKIKKRSGYISMDSISELESSFRYDVYVASSEDDREFVFGEMSPYLKENNLRLCIPEEDFIPGQNIYRMIVNAVHVSRTTILVVSRSSLQDREWKIAMHMCLEESLQRGHQIYFAVFIEDIPENILHHEKLTDIRHIYNSGAFITYPAQSASVEINAFWENCLRRIQ